MARIKPLPGLSDTSASGLSEIWVPKDVAHNLGSLLPIVFLVYLYAIEKSINSKGEISQWSHAAAARACGCSVAVAAAAYHCLVEKKLIEPVEGPRGQGAHPRVKVRVGKGRSSIRFPRVAMWEGPLEDGPRWGKDSAAAARTIVSILNQMQHMALVPTMHYPHDWVSKKAGLSSSVYRLGIPLLANQPWVDVTQRYRAAVDGGRAFGGVQQDSSEITFRWEVLRTAVEDRHALLALADAQKAHLTSTKSTILSTKPVDFTAGEPVDFTASETTGFTAGEPVDFTASIFMFSCLHVLSSSSSDPSNSCLVCDAPRTPTTSTPPAISGDGGVHKNEETKEQALAPTAMPLTIENVINAKSRQDVEPILQAVYDRCGGWWPTEMKDDEWHAAVIAAIVWAPIGHDLKLTVTQAEQLATDFLPFKAEYLTPLTVATGLVGASLNRDVRNPVAVLRRRVSQVLVGNGRGSMDDPKALLTTQNLVPNKIAASWRGEDASTKTSRVRGATSTRVRRTNSTRPHMITGRDRADGSTYSKDWGEDTPLTPEQFAIRYPSNPWGNPAPRDITDDASYPTVEQINADNASADEADDAFYAAAAKAVAAEQMNPWTADVRPIDMNDGSTYPKTFV